MPRSEELAAPVRRAEQATATARRLLRENGRLRRNAERQLDRLFELGLEFGRSGNPPPAVRTDLASKAGDALLDQDAMALPFRQGPVVASMARRGISSEMASSGSCTTAIPPQRLMALRPAAPSDNSPLRRTPITRDP